MSRTLIALATAAGLLLAGGCGAPRPAPPEPSEKPAGQQAAPSQKAQRPPPPASVGANELGVVPILMYHRITPDPSSVYDRTPEQFRAELQRLARENYVPVTTAEYASGNIDIPAGSHPVVLTFDDATTSQFSLNAAGEPAKGTAVRILLEVAENNPGFRPVASFYVTTPPFGGEEGALRWLHEHGFEIGNHTLEHPNLSSLSGRGVQRAIALMQRKITSAVPQAQVSTLALPFGVAPDDESLAVSGSFDGIRYEHGAVLLVGSNPAPSPFSAEFDPAAVPRIRSQGASGKGADFGSKAWLDRLAANPERRYTSDGNPEVISYPESSDAEPAPEYANRTQQY